ncbi:MAG: kinase [Legionellales bacterium]|nr:kinase [Legionellales bacterium]|tara:strand:- start:44068 stop:45291 length:1224 start_codon:yes stop_codon:yes gene_type:complete
MTFPTLQILLNEREIGTLSQLPGDRNLFVFNEDYVNDIARPTLSLSFKDKAGGLITNIRPTQTRLPTFFSNLLPEGEMRTYLAERANVKPEREFYLLWALGEDLPGAIRAVPIADSRLLQLNDDRDKSANIELEEDPLLRFSLAGVQLKFSALKNAHGGLTIPANGCGGDWIIKLPDTRFENVPENEYAMMELARHIGIDVPETALVPLDTIDGLPTEIEQHGKHAFVIKRFDRGGINGRVHIEDFAQIYAVYPQQKYKNASYRNIAEVIWLELGEVDLVEFIRRFVFNSLIGNGDMHLKNWSLIYPDGRHPQLAPAYDFVSTIPYIHNDTLALNFLKSKRFQDLSLEGFKLFANKTNLPEHVLLETVANTVADFKAVWDNSLEFGIETKIKDAIDKHLANLPLFKL